MGGHPDLRVGVLCMSILMAASPVCAIHLDGYGPAWTGDLEASPLQEETAGTPSDGGPIMPVDGSDPGPPAGEPVDSGTGVRSAPVHPAAFSSWSNMNPGISPSARERSAMAYDSESDRVVLFGGFYGTYLGDTWVYDFNTNTWSNMNPPGAPSPRRGHAMAYDVGSDRIILFGGYNGTFLNGTWAYDLNTNTWTNMNPSPSPSVRYEHAMAYDSESDRVILFGGWSSGRVGDTWAYDHNTNTWTLMSLASPISARYEHAMAYDSESDRVVLFGGDDGSPKGDTWTYDLNTNKWTRMSPTTKPGRRTAHALAYDSKSGSIVLFGGIYGTLRPDTWRYETASNTWEYVGSDMPPARYSHMMAYDLESNEVILFGGFDVAYLNDTWAYYLSILGPPRGAHASSGESSVTLTWSPPMEDGGSPIMAYRILRGTSPGGVGFLMMVSGSTFSYRDTPLTNGVTYYYRIRAVNGAGEIGPLSGGISALPAGTPTPPRKLTAVSGDWTITLEWDAPYFDGGKPVTNYTIYRGVVMGGESYYMSVPGSQKSYTDPSVVQGMTYYYMVSASNPVGEGGLSSEVSATAMMSPGSPYLMGVSGGARKITLTWDPPASDGGSSILSYQVWRGVSSGSETFLVSVSGGAVSATDWWVTPGVVYYYRVRAVNAVGPGPFSNEESGVATTGVPPPLRAGEGHPGEPATPLHGAATLDQAFPPLHRQVQATSTPSPGVILARW